MHGFCQTQRKDHIWPLGTEKHNARLYPMCKKSIQQKFLDIIYRIANDKQAFCKQGAGGNMGESIRNLGKPGTHKARKYAKL